MFSTSDLGSQTALCGSSNSSNASYSGSPSSGSPTHAATSPQTHPSLPALDVAGMLRKINAMRLDAQETSAAQIAAANKAIARNELPPSGPRKPGQGCEEVSQAIMLADVTSTGGVRLRITLLAAGFIIGPIGGCIREISRITGAEVRSRTVQADARCHRDCREFTIEGPSDAAVAHAMSIMMDAVKRYKSLCEGNCAGQVVSRSQHVAGVEFFYQPPPRSIVPLAACLKGHSKRSTSKTMINKHQQKPPRNDIPPRPCSFKEAVVGGQPSYTSPLKRSASAGLDAVLAAHPVMGWKVGKTAESGCIMDMGDEQNQSYGAEPTQVQTREGMMAAAAAATGLPLVSLAPQAPANDTNNNYVLNTHSGNVLVPLNLVLASQGLLPAGSNFTRACSAPSQMNPAMDFAQHAQHGQQESSTYSAGDLLNALTTQLQANLGLESHQQQHVVQAPQHAQQQHTPSPFYGQFAADQAMYAYQEVPQEDPTMVSAFTSVADSFHQQQQPQCNNNGNTFVGASSLRTVLSTDSAFSAAPSELTPRVLDAHHQNGIGSAFRTAFALPSFFHGQSPNVTPTPTRVNSLSSGLSGGVSRRTSLDRGNSGSLFYGAEDHGTGGGGQHHHGAPAAVPTTAGGDMWRAVGGPAPLTPAVWEPQTTAVIGDPQNLLRRSIWSLE